MNERELWRENGTDQEWKRASDMEKVAGAVYKAQK